MKCVLLSDLTSGIYFFCCQYSINITRLLFHPEKLSPCTGAFLFLRRERPNAKKEALTKMVISTSSYCLKCVFILKKLCSKL